MTEPNNEQDDLDPARGLFNGCWVALLMWALIIWGVCRMAGCGQ